MQDFPQALLDVADAVGGVDERVVGARAVDKQQRVAFADGRSRAGRTVRSRSSLLRDCALWPRAACRNRSAPGPAAAGRPSAARSAARARAGCPRWRAPARRALALVRHPGLVGQDAQHARLAGSRRARPRPRSRWRPDASACGRRRRACPGPHRWRHRATAPGRLLQRVDHHLGQIHRHLGAPLPCSCLGHRLGDFLVEGCHVPF